MLFLAVYLLPNIFEPLLWSPETNGAGFQSWADLFYQISGCPSVGSMKDEQETDWKKWFVFFRPHQNPAHITFWPLWPQTHWMCKIFYTSKIFFIQRALIFFKSSEDLNQQIWPIRPLQNQVSWCFTKIKQCSSADKREYTVLIAILILRARVHSHKQLWLHGLNLRLHLH